MNKRLVMLVVASGISLSYAMEQNRELKVGVFSDINKREQLQDFFYQGNVDGGKMFAVYDGHGQNKTKGHEVAQFLVEKMPQYFCQTANLKKSMQERMVEAFALADSDKFVVSKRCGSTASVVFIKDNVAHFAHVGDSRMLLEDSGKVGFYTEDHRENNANEYMRVVDAGAFWYNNRVCVPGGGSRALAVSRSLGDRHIDKKKETIIAEPEYTQISLSEKNKFLVLATDGLWDRVTNEEVAELLVKCYADTKDMSEFAKLLALLAIANGSTDNITVMIVDLLS